MSRRTEPVEYVFHLFVSLVLAGVGFLVASAFAAPPVPLIVAALLFLGYWGIFVIVVNSDGSSSSGGGGSFLDSLF